MQLPAAGEFDRIRAELAAQVVEGAPGAEILALGGDAILQVAHDAAQCAARLDGRARNP